MRRASSTFVIMNIKVMTERYIAPEIKNIELSESFVLCVSPGVQAGMVEDIDRIEFNW